MRCTSKIASVIGRNDFTTGGPIVRFGTKWPSITSKWTIVPPPLSAAWTSSARWAKSAERIEGASSTRMFLSQKSGRPVEILAKKGCTGWKFGRKGLDFYHRDTEVLGCSP